MSRKYLMDLIADRIVKMIVVERFSQREIAEQVGVCQPTISKIYNQGEEASITNTTLKKLCIYFSLYDEFKAYERNIR